MSCAPRKSLFANSRVLPFLLGVLVILVVFDGLISQFIVGAALGHEGNPLLKAWVGADAFLVVKALGAFICAFILWDMHRRWARLALISSWCFVAVYTGIVLWNLLVLFTARV